MLSSQPRRALPVMVEDRLDERDVLADMPRDPAQAQGEHTPDAGGEVVEPDERLSQMLVAGCGVDRPVHPGVELQQRARIDLRCLAIPLGSTSVHRTRIDRRGLLGQCCKLVAQLRILACCGPAGGDRFEDRAQLGDVDEIGDLDLRGERAAPGI